MAKAKAKPTVLCAVGNCGGRAQSSCARCQRRVCERHAGAAERAPHRSTPRCALCRLEDRRRSSALSRRLWFGAAILAFLAIGGYAMRANPKQGIALLFVVVLVAGLAYLYDRSLRRGVSMFSLRRRPPQPARDGD